MNTSVSNQKNLNTISKTIDSILVSDLGITELRHRILFTACIVATCRNGLEIRNTANPQNLFSAVKAKLHNLSRRNEQEAILQETLDEIRIPRELPKDKFAQLVSHIILLSDSYDESSYTEEDFICMLFRCFAGRHRRERISRSESSIDYTPAYIAEFLAVLLNVKSTDNLFDACLGYGSLMIAAANTVLKDSGIDIPRDYYANHVQGIEYDKSTFALSCANFLIHGHGTVPPGIMLRDAKSAGTSEWMHANLKAPLKVLMNPPFEQRNGCLDIVKNVLDAVPPGSWCAVILPGGKLDSKKGRLLLKEHSLKAVIRLPESLKKQWSLDTSVFVFYTGRPQNGEKIPGCSVTQDEIVSLLTAKKRPTLSLNDQNYWRRFFKIMGKDDLQWIDPEESFFIPDHEAPIYYEEDFCRAVMESIIFRGGDDPSDIMERLTKKIMYDSEISLFEDKVNITVRRRREDH